MKAGHNNRIKQMPPALSAIDNAGSNFCVPSAKAGEGHLLYSMDVTRKKMQVIRTIKYLEDTQSRIRELINNRIGNGYSEFMKQVDEMNSYLIKEYKYNPVVMDELKDQPKLVQPSIFNQNENEILSVGYLGALAPYLLIIFFTLTLPLTIIFLIIRWRNKDQAVEQLRQLDSHVNRLIMKIKITSE